MVYEVLLPNSILLSFPFYIGVKSGPQGDEVNLWVEEVVKGRPSYPPHPTAVGAATGQVQERERKSPSCYISSPCPRVQVRQILHLAQASTLNSDSASGWLCFSTFQCRRGWPVGVALRILSHATFGSKTRGLTCISSTHKWVSQHIAWCLFHACIFSMMSSLPF